MFLSFELYQYQYQYRDEDRDRDRYKYRGGENIYVKIVNSINLIVFCKEYSIIESQKVGKAISQKSYKSETVYQI